MNNQGGGVNISGAVGIVGGDIIGGNKIVINIVNPIGKIIEGAKVPPDPIPTWIKSVNFQSAGQKIRIGYPAVEWAHISFHN